MPVEHKVKVKEGEKLNKYLAFVRKLKEQWNMKVSVIPIVSRALGTVLENLGKKLDELETKERIETIQTTVLRKLARIL